MGSMVSGFRRATGVEKSKKKKKANPVVDSLITVVLLAAVIAILVWRFM
jgi:hypothetical protein